MILLLVLLGMIAISSRFVHIGTQGILVDETWVVPNTFLHFGEDSIFPKLFTYPQFLSLSPEKQELVRKIYDLHPVFQVTAYQASDVHPPLFHILNYYWGGWFGYGESTIRVPAALYFLLTLVLLVVIFRRMAIPAATGAVSLGLIVVSPIYLFFSNFARPYTLLVLLSLFSTYLCYEMIKRDFRRWTIFLYVITAAASLYTHYYGALTIAAQGIYLLMESWLLQRKKNIIKILFIEAMVFVLYLPWFFVMLYQMKYRYHLVTFEEFGLNSLIELFFSFGLGYSRSTLYSPINILVSTVQFLLCLKGIVVLWGEKKEQASRFWLFFFLVLMSLIVILNIVKPSFTVRNCLNLLIPYSFLCAVGLCSLKRVSLKLAVSVLLASVGLYFVFHGLSYGHLKGKLAMEDWRSTAAFIRGIGNPLPVYVYQPSYREPLYYYIPDKEKIRGLSKIYTKNGPDDQNFILVLVKPEEMPLEEKIEKDVPFMKDDEKFEVRNMAYFPHIYIYEIKQRLGPNRE